MNFDQYIPTKFLGTGHQFLHQAVIERRDDQQDRIGVRRALRTLKYMSTIKSLRITGSSTAARVSHMRFIRSLASWLQKTECWFRPPSSTRRRTALLGNLPPAGKLTA